jgi:hypothetical protein
LLFGTLLAALLAVPAGAGDWPQYLGPTRDGVSPEKGLLDTWPKEGPPLLWDKKLGQGFSSPVVVGDRVFVFHRVEDKETLECLDAATGKERWKYAYDTDYVDKFGFDEGPRDIPSQVLPVRPGITSMVVTSVASNFRPRKADRRDTR